MAYEWASGHDNEAGYADLTPQPATNALIAGRRTIGADLTLYEDGYQQTALIYTSILESELATLLTTLGLDSALSVELTLSLRTNEDRSTFGDYNVRVYRPNYGQGEGEFPTLRSFATDIRFPVVIIEST
jgi:hypothetical protein